MSKPKIILVDMDGVIANFELGFLKSWRQNYPLEIFIPLEKRQKLAVFKDYPPKLRKQAKNIYHQPNFFTNLHPIKGAITAIKEITSQGFEVFICTAPIISNRHCLDEKFLWISKHLGKKWTKKIIITKDKTLILADFLIDDNPQIIGVAKPKWQQIVFNQPYNQHLKLKRLTNWENWAQILT